MGDKIYTYDDSMVVCLQAQRKVVSSSNLNGGCRRDLRYLFNHSYCNTFFIQKKVVAKMERFDIVRHFEELAERLGLPTDRTSGMSTAARIENSAVARRSYHGVEVMSIATAGIDVNAGRAGEPAPHDEFKNQTIFEPGTINIFLFINARLDDGCLTRSIVTATEAKTAALQELMANSVYSEGLATGSGTDTIIAVANEASPTVLYSAGKHVLLGQMIGETVKEAVHNALAQQTGMTPQRQASICWQCRRYGFNPKRFQETLRKRYPHASEAAIQKHIDRKDKDPECLAVVAASLHLLDQEQWGILDAKTLLSTSERLLNKTFQFEEKEKWQPKEKLLTAIWEYLCSDFRSG